jgi:hypothetical protein
MDHYDFFPHTVPYCSQHVCKISKLNVSLLTFLYQVENLDIKNRLPPPPLSQEDLEQVFLRQDNPGLFLDQMVRGTFTLQDTQQEQEGFFP